MCGECVDKLRTTLELRSHANAQLLITFLSSPTMQNYRLSTSGPAYGHQRSQTPDHHHHPRPLLRGRIRCQATPSSQASSLPSTNQREFFQQLDQLLQQYEDPTAEARALELVKQQQEAGGMKAFGSLPQAVPKRIYTIEELRLNGIRAEALLSPTDNSLNTIRNITQGAAVAGLAAVAISQGDISPALSGAFALGFGLVLDQVLNQGGGEALVIDSLGHLLLPSYSSRTAMHEAGHLLVAYLVGVLPRAYTTSSRDAFLRFRRLNIQAGTQFCDGAFSKEVAGGRLSASSLEKYTCVALAGVVTEYLRFGQAEGGLGDVVQLDGMFRALGFTQKKADGEVRWAVLNVALMLRQYQSLQERLAEAMKQGKPVGELLAMIEAEVSATEKTEQAAVVNKAG